MRWMAIILIVVLTALAWGCSRKDAGDEGKALGGVSDEDNPSDSSALAGDYIVLPEPMTAGEMSLEEALASRRSLRSFSDEELTLQEVSQLLWATQGITLESKGFRIAPSAGALYPLEVYLLDSSAVYHYLPEKHALERISNLDLRQEMMSAALGQWAVGDAPAVFVITGVVQRTAAKYGKRAERYVYIEAGHSAQNLLLQATALGLGGVPIGAFYDDEVAEVLDLSGGELPIYIIPVGHGS